MSDIDIVTPYLEGASTRALATLTGRSPHWCANRLRDADVYMTRRDRRMYLASRRPGAGYFDTLDHPDKGYWLGLLFADGNVQDNKVRLCLQESDKTLVEAFARAFNVCAHSYSSRHRYNDKMCYWSEAQISNVYVSQRLQAMGLVKRKSTEADGTLLDNIPEALRPDFARGFFDGDGSISTGDTLACGCKTPQLEWVGLQPVLEHLRNWILEEVRIPETRLRQTILRIRRDPVVKGCEMYRMMISGFPAVVPILTWMYERQGPSLERKRLQFTSLSQHGERHAASTI